MLAVPVADQAPRFPGRQLRPSLHNWSQLDSSLRHSADLPSLVVPSPLRIGRKRSTRDTRPRVGGNPVEDRLDPRAFWRNVREAGPVTVWGSFVDTSLMRFMHGLPVATAGCSSDSAYTLYRDTVTEGGNAMRIHIATFDAADSEA